MSILPIDLNLWFMRLIVACFFSMGFIAFYHHTWKSTTAPHMSMAMKISKRFALLALILFISLFLFTLSAHITSNSGMLIYHNWTLFILIIPFFYADIAFYHYIFLIIALLWIWYQYHMTNFLEPNVIIATILFWSTIYFIHQYSKTIIRNWFYSCIAALAIPLFFWLTVPTHNIMNVIMTPHMDFQAVSFYFIMGVLTLRYFRKETIEDTESDKLEHLAHYDTLTNDKTYMLYQNEITDLFNSARKNHEPLTLVALDIDYFKQINDHYGHLAGNSILIGIANTLTEILREFPNQPFNIYRTDGEEFNIVFPNAHPQDIITIVKACSDTVGNKYFTHEGNDIKVTLSIGVTEIQNADKSIEDTYKRVDDNLYTSKQHGRNTITVNGKTLQTSNDNDVIAIYTFFAQGIVDYSQPNHPRVRNELLLRIYDYAHSRWTLPNNFDISYSTQVELISQVLEQTAVKRVNVNLTATQFLDANFARVLTEYKNSGIGPDELIVEITDIEDIARTRQISAIYRSAGVKIYIDDVGSDNSYELVRHLIPYVDGIKFALQNLRKQNSTEQLSERLSFWADVAHKNDLDFILEGIETEAEAKAAYNDLNVRYMQGYYFGRPNLPRLTR